MSMTIGGDETEVLMTIQGGGGRDKSVDDEPAAKDETIVSMTRRGYETPVSMTRREDAALFSSFLGGCV